MIKIFSVVNAIFFLKLIATAQCSTLSPFTLPFIEGFENYSDTIYNNDTLFCDGDFSWTFQASTSNGRAMCGNGSPVNNGGIGGVTFDVNAFSSFNHNELTLTLNLSNYSISDPIYLSFDCNNIADEPNVEDHIYIRGSNTDSWIDVFDWSVLPANTWINNTENINISDILNSNNQSFSSSFQVKFSQYDNYGYSSDGFAIDNIEIAEINCTKPQNAIISYQNLDSAIISWDNVTGVNWNIEYGIKGFSLGQGNIISTSNSTDTITQLLPNSIYEFYIQKNCSSSSFSSWTGPLTLYTYITNDSSCNAIEILPNGTPHFTHNINSSLQFGENFILSNSPNNTIWFKTTVPNSGHLAIETCLSKFNTELGAYTSPTICNDFTTYNEISTASFSSPSTQNICGVPGKASLELCNLTPGDIIHFWIGSYSPATEGEITFSVFDYSLSNTAGNPISDSINLCISDTFNLFNNLSNNLNNGSWNYPQNTNAIIRDSLVITSLMTYSSDTLLYIVENSCDSDTSSFKINISQQNHAGTPNNNNEYCNSSTVFLFNSLSGPLETTGNWYDVNNNLINNTTFTPNTLNLGLNKFSYIVNNNSCQADTSLIELNILNCTSIENHKSSNLQIYPNPNLGIFNFSSNKSGEIKIYDLIGNLIYFSSYESNDKLKLDLNEQPKGIYILQFNNEFESLNEKINIQ